MAPAKKVAYRVMFYKVIFWIAVTIAVCSMPMWLYWLGIAGFCLLGINTDNPLEVVNKYLERYYYGEGK